MSMFRSYQTNQTTNVVWDPPSRDDTAVEAVVTISRAVGNPQARALMRLCEAVLNGDMLDAQRELDELANRETP